MKFTLSWLKDHLETSSDLETICKTLNSIGLEVEKIEDPSKILASFRTALIMSAEKHPNADRLQVCHVNAGVGYEDVQVVCGAPNARQGLMTVFAPVGTYIPGSDLTLKAGKIRGELSNGMLCSAQELQLGENHDGIIELPADAPIGKAYIDYFNLNDPVIEIAITPNRGDALSIRNIARDLATAGLGRLKPLSTVKINGQFKSSIQWDNQFLEACPWILGRTIRHVTNGPSPEWLQTRLKAIDIQPKSLLVDITNFFTYDLGRPFHVFDVDKLSGEQLTLCSGDGENFLALNGKEYQVTQNDCIIVDKNGVQSLAGLIGGQESAVEESTTCVFLECALFNPVTIALSGRYHSIHTDARQRFERGIDNAFLPQAMDLATQMILDYGGGEASEVTVAGHEPNWRRKATLRYARLESFGGLAVPVPRVQQILTDLGFEIECQNEHSVTVQVPSWRNDIVMPLKMAQHPNLESEYANLLADTAAHLEGEVDLIEEVLRIVGLDNIPAVSLPLHHSIPSPALSIEQKRFFDAARLLASRGLVETVGFSFVDHEVAARLGEAPESLRLLNPISNDMDQLRPTPLASLLPAAQKNIARGLSDVALFEVGPVFTQHGEKTIAAGVRYGFMPRSIEGKALEVTIWDAKADVYFVLNGLGISCDSLQISTETPIYYHPGRSGQLRLGPKTLLAYFGELHPSLVKQCAFDQAPIIFEIMIDAIGVKKPSRKKPLFLSAFQPLKRDFAFVVKEKVEIGRIINTVKQIDRHFITNVELFDIYRGDKIPKGCKSIAIQVTIQPQTKSLKDEEIEKISQTIINKVALTTGGVLR